MKNHLTTGEIALKKIASIHEAGHAVIYHMYGHCISSILIDDNGSGIVNCSVHIPNSKIYGKTDNASINKRLNIYGVLCLSGYCAELKYQKIPIKGRIKILNDNESLENDISKLESVIRELNNKPNNDFGTDLHFYLIQNQTKEFIRKPKVWEAILSLSDELMSEENNSMDGDKAHEILNQHVKFGFMKTEHFL